MTSLMDLLKSIIVLYFWLNMVILLLIWFCFQDMSVKVEEKENEYIFES